MPYYNHLLFRFFQDPPYFSMYSIQLVLHEKLISSINQTSLLISLFFLILTSDTAFQLIILPPLDGS